MQPPRGAVFYGKPAPYALPSGTGAVPVPRCRIGDYQRLCWVGSYFTLLPHVGVLGDSYWPCRRQNIVVYARKLTRIAEKT